MPSRVLPQLGASACYKTGLSLEAFMDFIAGEGCTYMELREYVSDYHRVLDELDYEAIRRAARDRGLKLTFHTPLGLNLAEEDPSLRTQMLDGYFRCLELAEAVGPEVLVIHSGIHDDHEIGMERTLDGLRRLVERRGSQTYRLAVENGGRGFRQALEHPADVTAFLPLGVDFCIDMGHANTHGYQVRDFIEVCGAERIAEIHTHSNDGTSDQHLAITQGTVKVKEAFRDALLAGFRGPFMLENPSRERILDSMQFVRKHLIPALS